MIYFESLHIKKKAELFAVSDTLKFVTPCSENDVKTFFKNNCYYVCVCIVYAVTDKVQQKPTRTYLLNYGWLSNMLSWIPNIMGKGLNDPFVILYGENATIFKQTSSVCETFS